MEGGGFISPGDLELVRHFQDTDRAVGEITGFYRNYHSSRFFRDQYLIRLRKPVSRGNLERLNRDFKSMLKKGAFERFEEADQDDNKDPSLDRIIFYFDRASYNRLRELIDHLNAL